eukprot:SAG22_NODE_225_length_14728_cov_58.742361_13_plen_204_part_00
MAAKFSLAGCGALVTGGTKGIGLAIVRQLVELDAQVVTCARNTSPEALAGLPAVTVLECDISDRAQRARLVADAAETLRSAEGCRGLSVLVNNAGVNTRKPTVDFTQDEFDRIVSTNFESAFHLSQLAHPHLKTTAAVAADTPSSSIVNISSVSGGPTTTNTGAVYAATVRLECLPPHLWQRCLYAHRSCVPGRACYACRKGQ